MSRISENKNYHQNSRLGLRKRLFTLWPSGLLTVACVSSLLEGLFSSHNLKIWFIFPQTIEFKEFKMVWMITCTSQNNPMRSGLLLSFHETNDRTKVLQGEMTRPIFPQYRSLSKTISIDFDPMFLTILWHFLPSK